MNFPVTFVREALVVDSPQLTNSLRWDLTIIFVVAPGTKFCTGVRELLRENSPLLYTVNLLALDVLLNTCMNWLVRRHFFYVVHLGEPHVLALLWVYVGKRCIKFFAPGYLRTMIQ